MSRRRLSSSDRLAIVQAIESSTGPGIERDLLKWRYLCGRRALPSRREFIEAFIQLKDKKSGSVGHILLNSAQRTVEATRIKHQRAGKLERYATLKARQLGMTRYWLACGIEAVTRSEYFPACIIADEQENAKAILEDGKIMRDKLPYRLPTKYENRSQLYFDKPIMGFIDIETAKSDDPCRSRTYRLIHCTEPGIWKDPERKVASINQAVPDEPGTVISYEGTANGQGNWWYDFWWAAYHGKNDYHAFFFPWFVDRDFDYSIPLEEGELQDLLASLDDEEQALLAHGCQPEQLKWRRYAVRNRFFGDLDLFHQEFPAFPEEAWLASGRPCFQPLHVLAARRTCKDPIWQGDILVGNRDPVTEHLKYTLSPNPKGAFKVWAWPQIGRVYCQGADCGDGIEYGDRSSSCILDMETGHVVAEWNGIISTSDFGRIVSCIGWEYNTAYSMPEIERAGIAVLDAMKEAGYHMIGRRPVYDTAGRLIGRKLAWSTNAKTRPMLFNEIRKVIALGDERPELNSEELCQEMLFMFIDPSGREDHPSGKHDDRVLAYGIALMARKDAVESGMLQEAEEKKPRTPDEYHWWKFHQEVGDGLDRSAE